MPLYEYKCDRCGEVFEIIQKFADTPLEQHDKCGGHVERLLSAPALQFKGTGWYVTDYARGSNGKSQSKNEKSDKAAEKSEKTNKESGSGDGKKTESSKPASTTSTSSTAEKK